MLGRRKLYVPTCKGRQGLKFILACILVFSALPSLVCASTLTIDDYFERALDAADQIKRNADELVRLEASGELDFKNKPEQIGRMESDLAAFKYNLKMASDGGHPIASYLLANTLSKPGPTEQQRRETCDLYEKAMDQGLLAAAVAYFHRCDQVYMKSDRRDAGHLKYLQTLEELLQQADIFADFYPMQAKRALCFQDLRAGMPKDRVMGALQARTVALMLTEDQYRAEANYILAMSRVNESGKLDSQNVVYLDKAEALGCHDFIGINTKIRGEAQASKTQ